jgi:hypothetical protein
VRPVIGKDGYPVSHVPYPVRKMKIASEIEYNRGASQHYTTLAQPVSARRPILAKCPFCIGSHL